MATQVVRNLIALQQPLPCTQIEARGDVPARDLYSCTLPRGYAVAVLGGGKFVPVGDTDMVQSVLLESVEDGRLMLFRALPADVERATGRRLIATQGSAGFPDYRLADAETR